PRRILPLDLRLELVVPAKFLARLVRPEQPLERPPDPAVPVDQRPVTVERRPATHAGNLLVPPSNRTGSSKELARSYVVVGAARHAFLAPRGWVGVWDGSNAALQSRRGLIVEALEHDAGVVPTEAEAVRDGDLNVGVARLVRDVVEIARGIGDLV